MTIIPSRSDNTQTFSIPTEYPILVVPPIHRTTERPLGIEERNSDFTFEPRRSTRPHKAPSHLSDFVCDNTKWCNLIYFSVLPNE